jgi:DNA-binding transcriptional LysR family regulator
LKYITFQRLRTEKTMDLYQLEYFLEAARERSFTRAAAKLNLAQAALSEQMRKLEGELGAKLFDRGRRETTLTPAGETLRLHAEALLAQASVARWAVGDLVAMKAGRLAVGAIPSVSACLLPAAVAGFRRKHPQVELALHEGTSEAVAQWVESGKIELGVVQLPAPGESFEVTPLLEESFVLLLPKKHPLARRRQPKLAELTKESFIFYKGRARDVAQAACRSAGFEPRTACESGELETVRSLVAADLGVALLPELAARGAVPGCAVVRLGGEPIRRSVALLQRRGREISPAARSFRRLLLGEAGA